MCLCASEVEWDSCIDHLEVALLSTHESEIVDSHHALALVEQFAVVSSVHFDLSVEEVDSLFRVSCHFYMVGNLGQVRLKTDSCVHGVWCLIVYDCLSEMIAPAIPPITMIARTEMLRMRMNVSFDMLLLICFR